MATEEQFQTLMSMVSSMTAKLEQLQEDVSSMKGDQKSMKEDQKSMKEDQKKLNDKLEELQGSLDLQKKLMKPLYTIKPVPEDVISVLTTDTFRNNVLELYKMRYCIVLSQLFPCQKPDYWFPAATAHIVPRQQWQTANLCGFQATDARNGLPLLKDLELKYQAGHFTVIPTGVFVDDAVQLEIHVAGSPKDVWIRYRERDGCDNGQVKGLKRNVRGTSLCNLRFGDLDKKTIVVRPKPYMRALYLKANMAHDQHPHDLPHPSRYLDRYTSDCEAMKGELFQRLLAGNGYQEQSALEAS